LRDEMTTGTICKLKQKLSETGLYVYADTCSRVVSHGTKYLVLVSVLEFQVPLSVPVLSKKGLDIIN